MNRVFAAQRRLQLTLGTGLVTLFVWWRTAAIDGPFLFHDEFGYVAVSRWLAGPQTPELFGPLYHPGYGLLLSPLAAVVSDPAQFHTWATFTNALMVGLVFLASAALGARLGLSQTQQLAVAAVACTGSAIVLFTGMLVAEVLLTLVVTVCVLSLWRLFESGSNQSAVIAGLAIAAGYLVHARGIVLLIAFGLTIALGRFKRAPLLTLGIAAAGCVASYLLTNHVENEIYAAVVAPRPGSMLDSAVGDPVLLAKAIVGTSWYLTASTFGLAVWGLVGAARLASIRHSATASVATFVFFSVAGSVALSGIFTASLLADPARARPDVITYGRYVEQWIPVLLVFGLAELLRSRVLARRKLDGWIAASVAITAGVVVAGPIVFASFAPATRSGPTAISNSSALGWFWFQTGSLDLTRWSWVIASVVASASFAGFYRYWMPLLAIFLWSQLAIQRTVNDWAKPAAERWEKRGLVEGASFESPYVYAVDSDPLFIYGLQYWQPDLDVDIVIPFSPENESTENERLSESD